MAGLGLKLKKFQTETALMYDAVILFAEALSELDRSQDVQVNPHQHRDQSCKNLANRGNVYWCFFAP